MDTLRLGVIGAGQFLAHSFLRTFQAHPGVGEILVADLDLARAEDLAQRHDLAGAFDGIDPLLAAGVDAVAIFTPRDTHAPLALKAMEAGAHAYMAVPAAVTLEELAALAETAARTRRVCMTGETSHYYPEVVFCREEFASGRWGRFVHADAQYVHDWATWGPHFRNTFGEDWRAHAAIPPMHYATHSFSMPLSITGAHVTHVSALGFVDTHPDGGYGTGRNPWDNPFSNTVALGRTSDGGSVRVGEFRRLGWFAQRSGREVMMPAFYCTDAAFEENMGGTFLSARQGSEGTLGWEHETRFTQDLGPWIDGPYFEGAGAADRFMALAPAHHPARLPDAMRGLPNGHAGSHLFLVDDFVRACLEGGAAALPRLELGGLGRAGARRPDERARGWAPDGGARLRPAAHGLAPAGRPGPSRRPGEAGAASPGPRPR